jgi:hypothetical protein
LPGGGRGGTGRDPERHVEEPSDLAIRKPDLVLELADKGLGIGSELRGRCAQRVGGLQWVSPLNSAAAATAVADLYVELTPDHATRDLGLVLGANCEELDVSTAIWTGVRKLGLVHFVDPRRSPAESLAAVAMARFASRLLGLGLGFLLRERSSLSLEFALQSLDQEPESLQLLPQRLALPPQPAVLLDELVVRRPLLFFSGHQPWISADPVTSLSPFCCGPPRSACGPAKQVLITLYSELRSVWKHARKVLCEAEQIFIIGYSLPKADQFFRDLFSIGTLGKTRIKRIWTVDPDPKGEVEKRCMAFLGDHVKKRYAAYQRAFSDLQSLLRNSASDVFDNLW